MAGLETAEVVIVGGGVVGLSIAYHLATLGGQGIVLLEREAVLGSGSTERSAGGVRLQFGTPVNIQLSQWSLAFLKRMRDEVGADPGLRQVGYLFLTADPQRAAQLESNVRLQQALGVPVQALAPPAIAARYPYLASDGLLAANFCPEDGYADPHAVVQGLARRARELGVAIRTGVEVTAVHLREGRVDGVETRAGPLRAPAVVNATGPFAAAVARMAGVDLPVRPFRRQIYVTAPFAGLPADMPMVIDFDTSSYVRREGAGLLMGASDPAEPSSFRTEADDSTLVLLAQTIMQRVPALADAEILRGWAGLYAVTPDENAILGPVPGLVGFYLANGFSGHGFQQAPAVGRVLAEMILGRTPTIDVSPLSLTRFRDGRLIRESAAV